ncbi:FAD-dependent oxidoreductase [Streptomyces sioyaensis]|uniref:FAD-dependent oxidoreductase n=1 Tax=Streptomyces sioyaensis TaxID=67364 RepID=UPI0037D2C4B0
MHSERPRIPLNASSWSAPPWPGCAPPRPCASPPWRCPVGALGGVVGRAATGWYRDAGVDLRLGTTGRALEGDARGRLRRALLSDGTAVEAEVALVAAGAMANTGWLAGFGLAADAHGVACDHTCRALADDGTPMADVFVAGGGVGRDGGDQAAPMAVGGHEAVLGE